MLLGPDSKSEVARVTLGSDAFYGTYYAESLVVSPADPDVVAEVFGRVTSPGRLEVVGHQPLVLLDGAHNVAGVHALTAALQMSCVLHGLHRAIFRMRKGRC